VTGGAAGLKGAEDRNRGGSTSALAHLGRLGDTTMVHEPHGDHAVCTGCYVKIEDPQCLKALMQPTKSRTLSVLQLRRLLRALGQPTAGLRGVLEARLQSAVAKGDGERLYERLQSDERVPQACVVDARDRRTGVIKSKQQDEGSMTPLKPNAKKGEDAQQDEVSNWEPPSPQVVEVIDAPIRMMMRNESGKVNSSRFLMGVSAPTSNPGSPSSAPAVAMAAAAGGGAGKSPASTMSSTPPPYSPPSATAAVPSSATAPLPSAPSSQAASALPHPPAPPIILSNPSSPNSAALDAKKKEIMARMQDERMRQSENSRGRASAAAESSPAMSPAGQDDHDPERESYDDYPVNAPKPHALKAEAAAEESGSSDSEDEATAKNTAAEQAYEAKTAAAATKAAPSAASAPSVPSPATPAPSTDTSGIPDWAKGANLSALLEKQFGAKNPIDPDTIFPEFDTVDLEHVFETKKKRYTKRTSSGNWMQDKLTIAEKISYNRAMGYEKTSTWHSQPR
jgi:hypothetical protein